MTRCAEDLEQCLRFLPQHLGPMVKVGGMTLKLATDMEPEADQH